MRKLDVKVSREINATAEQVWQILGPNFLTISEWGGGILSSVNNPEMKIVFDGAPAGGRICNVKGFGDFHEKILHYSDAKREITWSADSPKIPGFVSGLQNAFQIKDTGHGKSIITSNLTSDLKGFRAWLLGGVMKKNFSKTIEAFLSDLAVYAETGEVSAKKKRELERR